MTVLKAIKDADFYEKRMQKKTPCIETVDIGIILSSEISSAVIEKVVYERLA